MSKVPTSSRSSTGQAEHPQALLALCPIPSRDLLLSSGKPQHGMLRGPTGMLRPPKNHGEGVGTPGEPAAARISPSSNPQLGDSRSQTRLQLQMLVKSYK